MNNSELFDVQQALNEMMWLHEVMELLLEKMSTSHEGWQKYYPAFKVLLKENATLYDVIVKRTGKTPQWEGNICTLGEKKL